jgi:rfaE bifunctional protein kinase chain/domain
MHPPRFEALAARYAGLKIALAGDFCLDRYLEIDPARQERSIETGRPVHNVTGVRAQPGGAGTILNNLLALGVGEVWPVGFCGDDGEGYELRAALGARPAVRLDHFLATNQRRTFTYCKPLVISPGQPPIELDRLDTKNWTPTPEPVVTRLAQAIETLAPDMDALVLLDQVDLAGTGVLCPAVLEAVQRVARQHPGLKILADSRRGLRDFPPVMFKLNAAEFATLAGLPAAPAPDALPGLLAAFARHHGQPVVVTAAHPGRWGARPDGQVAHACALPVRGPIDIVGAGDSVTANLVCALAAGATLAEALKIASAAASVVIHQLGTTGTASPGEIMALL